MQPHSLSGRTICIVDDDDLVRRMMSINLRERGLAVREAANGAELCGVMEQERLDCILMDYDLASETGLHVREQLRQRFVNVPPVVMLTGIDNQRAIIKAFRTGVDDYLIKSGLRIDELLQSLGVVIERRADEDARKAELERLKRLTDIDDATGLYRRDVLEGMLAKLLDASQAARKPFAVVCVRINELQAVQVQAGQVAARRVLGAFATRLRKAMRPTDVCGLGEADTFTCLLDLSSSRRDAEKLIAILNEALTFTYNADALNFGITADFGSAFYPDDAGSPDELLRVAVGNFGPAPTDMAAVADRGTVAAMPTERRAHVRQRVFKGGQIVTNGGRSVVDCTVRDISPGGARLKLKGAFTAPDSFELHVLGSGKHQRARLAWQKGSEIGVAFLD